MKPARTKKLKFLCVLVALGLAFLWFMPAMAQTRVDTSGLKQRFDEAYLQLLENPSDRMLNLNYAGLAMQMRDYEAAISPLERILMNEPANAKIRLQVGILYQSLGSQLIAEQYFLEAMNTPGASADVVKQAKGYIDAM